MWRGEGGGWRGMVCVRVVGRWWEGDGVCVERGGRWLEGDGVCEGGREVVGRRRCVCGGGGGGGRRRMTRLVDMH